MKKRNLLFTLLLLFAFVSLCSLYVSYVKINAGYDDKQKDLNFNILMTPKSSGYEVTQRWNYTSDYEVNSVAVSADGRYVAVGVEDIVFRGGDPSHSLFFFNTSDHDGIPLWSYDLDWPITSLAISADGRYIAAISNLIDVAFLFNSTVPEPGEDKYEIWYVDLGGMGGDLYSVDISADGKYIVLGGDDGSDGLILLYNNSYASSGYDKTDEILWFCDPNFPVYSVAISADGKYVAAGTDYIIVRDADPSHVVFFLNTTDYILGDFQMPMWSFDAGVPIDSIAISGDGRYIVAGSYDGMMAYLLNSTVPEPGEDKYEVWFVDWGEFIYPVDISADGRIIVMGSEDGFDSYVNVYNNSYASSGYDKTYEYLWYYETPDFVTSLAISADGNYIVAGTACTANEDAIFLFNNTNYELGDDDHKPTWSFNTTGDNIYSVSMSAWGNYIAAGGDYVTDGRTYLFYHARPIPRIFYGNGGDDDDDDEEEGVVPFGNYYLLFVAIAVASLIIITKRRTFFSKK